MVKQCKFLIKMLITVYSNLYWNSITNLINLGMMINNLILNCSQKQVNHQRQMKEDKMIKFILSFRTMMIKKKQHALNSLHY